MTDPTRIDVARVELREAYGFDGKSERFLHATDWRIAYEPDTDKLVVQRKGSLRVHVIPWANVNGFELVSQTPPATVTTEVANAGPAASGGSRRARPQT